MDEQPMPDRGYGSTPAACPCLHTTPCQPNCTCVNGLMSHGCLRCCTYGSKEQQVAKAEWLAKAIDAANADQREGLVSDPTE